MPLILLRWLLALLIVTAYLGATVFQVAPVYAANADMSSGSMNGMMHDQHGRRKDALQGHAAELHDGHRLHFPVKSAGRTGA